MNHQVTEAAQHQTASATNRSRGQGAGCWRGGRAAGQKQSASGCEAAGNCQGLPGGNDRRLLRPVAPIISQRVNCFRSDIISVRQARADISKYHIVSGSWHAAGRPIAAVGPVATGGIIPSGCGASQLSQGQPGGQSENCWDLQIQFGANNVHGKCGGCGWLMGVFMELKMRVLKQFLMVDFWLKKASNRRRQKSCPR